MTEKINKNLPPLTFSYVNWEGQKAVRNVIPMRIYYGQTEWHPEDQWLLIAWDLDKDAERTFALKDIQEFFPSET